MGPKVYVFKDLEKALNYYKLMCNKLNYYNSKYNYLWYKISIQSLNVNNDISHKVTIELGVNYEEDISLVNLLKK